MDLSKLYYEKELEAQDKIDADRIVSAWIADASKSADVDASKSFSNIKMKNIPSYFFKFEFQKVVRTFYEGEKAYTSNIDIPPVPLNSPLESFTFDGVQLRDVSFDDLPASFDGTIAKTQKICECSDCRGLGSSLCPQCKGAKRGRCPDCGNRRGFELCPDCRGENGKYDSNGKWRVCKRCNGQGEITCRRCNGTGEVNCPTCKGQGRLICKTCNGTGKTIKYIGVKDEFSLIDPFEGETESSSKQSDLGASKAAHGFRNWLARPMIYYHASVPKKLQEQLEGNSNDSDLLENRLYAYTDGEPIVDSVDKPSLVKDSLHLDKLSDIYEQYDDVEHQYIIGNEYSNVGDGENETCKVIKVRTRIYKIDLVRVSYEYDGKPYELWLYGKDKLIFNETNPFLSKAKSLEDEAEELRKQKKPTEAIKKYEEAFRIAEASKNYKALHIYHNRLKYTRIDSNKDFSIGLYIGLALTALFYLLAIKKLPLDYPTSAGVFTDVLSIQSEKAVGILSKITNVLANYVAPFALFYALLFNCVRDKIKNKIARIALACALPVLYTAVITLLFSKVAAFTPSVFVMTGGTVLLAAIIIACTVKVPYSKIPSQFDDVDLEKSPEKIAEKESEKSAFKSDDADDSDEISPKHRAIALVLSLFVGFIGVHRFYAGKVKSGLLQLAVFIAASFFAGGVEGEPDSAKPMLGGIILGILGIWVFVDFILICAGNFKDKHGDRIKNW